MPTSSVNYNNWSSPIYLGRRGFSIIFIHYNGSRAFINNFHINAYNNLPPLSSSMGYVNSFGNEVYYYYTFVNHFGSRGSLTTSVRTFTSTTMTPSTTPSVTEDLVIGTSQ